MLTPYNPETPVDSGLSINSTVRLSADQNGWTQQPGSVRRSTVGMNGTGVDVSGISVGPAPSADKLVPASGAWLSGGGVRPVPLLHADRVARIASIAISIGFT